jgi:S1-C subfamily serine protease
MEIVPMLLRLRSRHALGIIILFAFLNAATADDDALPPETIKLMEAATVRIIATKRAGPIPRRVASGFRWLDAISVVTSLHVVVGAENILVEFAGPKIETSAAHVVAQDPEAELALLRLDRPFSAGRPLEARAAATNASQLWVVGYPLEVTGLRSVRLRLSDIAPKTLSDAVDESARDDLTRLGFPSLDLSVLQVEGSLLPGDSGSPIVDRTGAVVGIGDGGLRRGTVGLGWGIPSDLLDKLPRSLGTGPIVNDAILAKVKSSFFAEASNEKIEASLWDATREQATVDAYQAFLDRFPGGAFADLARSKLAELARQYQQAFDYFQRATDYEARIGFGGDVDSVKTAHDRAEGELRRAIAIYPKFQAAHFALGKSTYLMAGLLTSKNDKTSAFRKAIGYFDDALDLNVNQADVYLYRGFAYASIDDPKYACDDYIQFQRLKHTLSPRLFEVYRQQLRFSREFLRYNGCAMPADIDYIDANDVMTGKGDQPPVDKDCKPYWYEGEAEFCAEHGSLEGMNRVADEIYTIANKIGMLSPEDTLKIENSVRYAHELASREDRRGYYHLGELYFDAYGEYSDPDLAFSYTKKAADLDYADAFFTLGHAYFYGRGTTRNVEAARQAWARGAVLGDVHSNSELSRFDETLAYSQKRAKLKNDFLAIIGRGTGSGYSFATKVDDMTDKLEAASRGPGGAGYLLGTAIDCLSEMRESAPEIVPALTKLYPNADEAIRQRIRIALPQLRYSTPEAAKLMADVAMAVKPTEAAARINLDDTARIRGEALIALASFGAGSATSIDVIAPLLKSADRYTRMLALAVVKKSGDRSKRNLATPLLSDDSPMVRAEAQRFLNSP